MRFLYTEAEFLKVFSLYEDMDRGRAGALAIKLVNTDGINYIAILGVLVRESCKSCLIKEVQSSFSDQAVIYNIAYYKSVHLVIAITIQLGYPSVCYTTLHCTALHYTALKTDYHTAKFLTSPPS